MKGALSLKIQPFYHYLKMKGASDFFVGRLVMSSALPFLLTLQHCLAS